MGKPKSSWSAQLEDTLFESSGIPGKVMCKFCAEVLARSSKPKLSRHLGFDCEVLRDLAEDEERTTACWWRLLTTPLRA